MQKTVESYVLVFKLDEFYNMHYADQSEQLCWKAACFWKEKKWNLDFFLWIRSPISKLTSFEETEEEEKMREN
jgi:hypothetical protein